MYNTVVEVPEFIKQVEKLLDEEERINLIDYLATHPKEGAIIQGTGGIRKIRWKGKSKGKRGGVRVIYYFHNESMPLFLLTLFSKGEKENLSKAEQNELAKLTKTIVETYRRKK